MHKIPAISIDGVGWPEQRLVAAVNLDRVDPGIRGDVVRELALGSSPEDYVWRKESRLYDVKPTGLLAAMLEVFGIEGLLLVFLPAAAVSIMVYLAWGHWAMLTVAGVMAVVAVLVSLPWTVAQRRRPVEFLDAVVAQVYETDLDQGPQNSLRRVTFAVQKLYEAGSPALTDEMWMLAYQVGADLAVAHRMRTVGDADTDGAASRLERRAVEIANQFDAVVHSEIERPQRMEEAAAEEEQRLAIRAELAEYLGAELPGRYSADLGEPTDRFDLLPERRPDSPAASTNGAKKNWGIRRLLSWLADGRR